MNSSKTRLHGDRDLKLFRKGDYRTYDETWGLSRILQCGRTFGALLGTTT